MADNSALNLLAEVTNKFESEGTILSELVNFASSVPDFRRSNKGNIRHRLRDMLILIIFARASGRVGRVDIIDFGRSNLGRFHIRLAGARALVDRKHALELRGQSSTGQDKTQVYQIGAQPRHHPKECPLHILNLEKAAQKDDRQKKGHSRTNETCRGRLY